MSWYYQQVLKISFIINFVEDNNQNIIIWDADTIILKKINFFNKDSSCVYGTFFEFHKPYFSTNKRILGNLPRIFISSIVQFVSFTKEDCKNLKSKLNKFILFDEEHKVSKWISKIILKSIFDEHVRYNGSLFSEFELIECVNYYSVQKNKFQ